VLTPPTYQRGLLAPALVPASHAVASMSIPFGTSGSGYLFSGVASALDAFRPYRLARSCPAMPCRTTGKPEAPVACSSRTEATFPSGTQHPRKIASDLSHAPYPLVSKRGRLYHRPLEERGRRRIAARIFLKHVPPRHKGSVVTGTKGACTSFLKSHRVL